MKRITFVFSIAMLIVAMSFQGNLTDASQTGEEYMRLRQFSKAVKFFEKRKKTPEVHFNLGRAYYELEQFDKAAENFAQAAAKTLSISNPDSLFLLSEKRRKFWCDAALREAISRLRDTNESKLEKDTLLEDCAIILDSHSDYPEFVQLCFDIASMCDDTKLANIALDILRKKFPESGYIYNSLRDKFISVIINRDKVEMRKQIAEILKDEKDNTDIYAYLFSINLKLDMNKEAMGEGEEVLLKKEVIKRLIDKGFSSTNPYMLLHISTFLHKLEDYLGEITVAARLQKLLDGMKQPSWISDERIWEGDKATMLARSWVNIANAQFKRGEYSEAQDTLDRFYSTEKDVDQFDPRSMLEADYFKRGYAGLARILQAELYIRRSDKFNATMKLCEAMRYLDSNKTIVSMAEKVFRKIAADPDTKLSSVAAIFDNTERFKDVTSTLIPANTKCNRISFCDVNVDGKDDILATKSHPKLLVYKDGKYTDQTEKMQLPNTKFEGGIFADFNMDGYPDLFLFGDEQCLLFRNDQGVKFVDVTKESGIVAHKLSTHSSCWGDFNSDGLVDLYICNRPNVWHSGHGLNPAHSFDQLYMNNGDGTFTDNSKMLDQYVSKSSGRGVAPCDFDRDGNFDLFVANYSLHPNALYRNLGKKAGLKNIGWTTKTAGVGSENPIETYYGHSVGAAWADLDNNGKPDLVAPNLAHPRVINISDRSCIFMNFTRGETIRFSPKRLLPYNETYSLPAIADFDGDGDMDIYLTAIYPNQPSHLFQNLYMEKGKTLFKDVGFASGSLIYNGWGCVFHDFDGDADPDLFVSSNGKLQIFENQAKANFIKVRYRSPGVGFGTEVWVYDKNGKRVFMLNGAKGSGDQDPMEICVGIGFQKTAKKIVINYRGNKIAFENVLAGETVEIDFDLFED